MSFFHSPAGQQNYELPKWAVSVVQIGLLAEEAPLCYRSEATS
jgi:hypothetical protein